MFIFKYETIISALKKYSINHYETINDIKSLFSINEGIKTANLVKDKFMNFEKSQ